MHFENCGCVANRLVVPEDVCGADYRIWHRCEPMTDSTIENLISLSALGIVLLIHDTSCGIDWNYPGFAVYFYWKLHLFGESCV
jgi:hypothetical protein